MKVDREGQTRGKVVKIERMDRKGFKRGKGKEEEKKGGGEKKKKEEGRREELVKKTKTFYLSGQENASKTTQASDNFIYPTKNKTNQGRVSILRAVTYSCLT